MARLRFLLAACLLAGGLAAESRAEDAVPVPSPSPPSLPSPPPPVNAVAQRPPRLRDPRGPADSRLEEIHNLFEKLPADLRAQLMEKARRWQQLPADEQAHFRFIRGEREKRARKAVEDTIAGSGLKLDEDQRQKFTEIYKRERRKLEEQLRAEMDQRRQERLPELQKSVLEAYQKEAAATPAPSATP